MAAAPQPTLRHRAAILAVALAALVTVCGLMTTPSAHAAQKCGKTTRTIVLPGAKPNINVGIRRCVWTWGTGGIGGHAYVNWDSLHELGQARRFRKFNLWLVLQRNNVSIPGTYRKCEIASTMKNKLKFEKYFCKTPGIDASGDPNGRYGLDAWVAYDKYDDGVFFPRSCRKAPPGCWLMREVGRINPF